MENDKDICSNLIFSAFMRAYYSPKIPNIYSHNTNKDCTLYYSYNDDLQLRKRIAQCFIKYPKIVESNRKFIEDKLKTQYPGIIINVAFNGSLDLEGIIYPFITASL